MVSQQCSLENFSDLASYSWFVVEIESLRPLNVMKLKGRPLLNYFLRFPFGILSKQNKSFCSFPFFFLCGFALKRSFVCKQKALAVYTPHSLAFSTWRQSHASVLSKHIYTILWLRPPDHQPGKCCGSAIFFFFKCGCSDQFTRILINFSRP
jgi:hypothetical protein